MGMNWDFTNYTFSFLVSLIGTVLGICYPLFLENIRKIDDQYQSTVLAKRFQDAWVFKAYRIILLLAIIISFAAPFVMLLSDNVIVNILIETIHCICVLALVLVMLSLFRVIQDYYNPESLSSLLFDDSVPVNPTERKDKLMAAVDLMRYSCERNNMEVYQKSKEFVLRVAMEEQKGIEHKCYNFSIPLQETVKRITDLSTDENLKPLCYDNMVAQIFYNVLAKGYNGDLNLQTIWWALYKIMESDNIEWFQQYWSAAIGYYSFGVNNDERSKKMITLALNARTRFLEMHRMLGTMLVYHQKFDWLHYALTTDNVSPPVFNLVPGTLEDIISGLEDIEKQTVIPWQLTSKYQMKGMFNDINSDFAIIEQVYRYFALLVIRLFSYSDYNINSRNPMQSPEISGLDLKELKVLKNMVMRLHEKIEKYWYAKKLISKIDLPITPRKEEVCKLLDDFTDEISHKIDFHITNPKLDKDKLEGLKGLLVSIDNKIIPLADSPTEVERKTWVKKEKTFVTLHQMDASLCSEDGYKGWSNYPDVLLHELNDKIARYLDICYSCLNPTVGLNITERNFFRALDKLHISNDYIILAMGVYLGGIDAKYHNMSILQYNYTNNTCSYKKIPVLERNSVLSTVFILKASDMIKIETKSFATDEKLFEGMKPLPESNYHLYSNIDEIIAQDSVTPVMKIGKLVCYYSNKQIKFIRIRVKRDGDDTVALASLKTMKEYLGIEKHVLTE